MDVSIRTALSEAADQLRARGIDEPRLDAGLLLCHALGCDRVFLLAHDDRLLSAEQLQKFSDFVSRRAAGAPLQYITGHQEFFKLDFAVTPDVLIPRPETELIVEAALELFAPASKLSFADVGVGSGCIAISILRERPQARAVAIDASPGALKVAAQNAALYEVDDRMRLVQSDLFAGLPQPDLLDLIVSNPPYIPDDELTELQREVRREPQSALAGGPDGLDLIRRLLIEAPRYLRTAGYLIFEFGINQDKAIVEMLDRDVWKLIEVRRDLQGIPRTIILRKN